MVKKGLISWLGLVRETAVKKAEGRDKVFYFLHFSKSQDKKILFWLTEVDTGRK